ncbi:DUF4845 domain-containing protein [Proteobacteria bacterium 005FR1]|nr:DUF4845 domain-containing protein [Proteobacteria bacterium 005FR1]
MKTRHSQRGLSSLGWLLVLLIAGFFMTLAFRMVPAYADNVYVTDALKSLREFESTERGYGGMTDSAIRSHLGKYFSINNVRGDATKNIKIERLSDKVLVNMDYEVRVPLFYNVDVVMKFRNQFDSLRPAECCKPLE